MKCPIALLAVIALPLSSLAQTETGLIEKGRVLFNDPRLSGSGLFSCASCHPMNGHTNNKTYVGVEVVVDGDPRGRSTPTLWGAAQRLAYWSWAGTIPTLEASIRGEIVERMKGRQPTLEMVTALTAYTRSLPHRPAPLLDEAGIPHTTAPAAVKRGYALFAGKAGCMNCHEPPSYDSKGVEDVGSGGTFKAPSLRSAAQTAPYFHDGRFKTLDEAVNAMSDGAVGLMTNAFRRRTGVADKLSDAEKRDIVAFLKAL
jgi:cytochrome c peroxidase